MCFKSNFTLHFPIHEYRFVQEWVIDNSHQMTKNGISAMLEHQNTLMDTLKKTICFKSNLAVPFPIHKYCITQGWVIGNSHQMAKNGFSQFTKKA